MTVSNFPNGISSFGAMVTGGGLPPCGPKGRYIFVDADNGNDAYDGLSWDSALKTVAAAVDMATTNKGDVIVLSTYGSHNLTSMLTISKSRLHFIGDTSGRLYGQATKINMGVTTAVTDVFAVKNLGTRNIFTGIKFMASNTLTQNVGTFGEGGMDYTLFNNCEFYNSAKLDSDTHAELILNGDSPQFFNCTFGSLADVVAGNKVRPAVRLANGVVGAGLVTRDAYFQNCQFWKNAGGTSTTMVLLASDDDLERGMEFKDCAFKAAKLGSLPAVAVAHPTLTKSEILYSGSTVPVHCTKIATGTGSISGLPARVATATIGIQAT